MEARSKSPYSYSQMLSHSLYKRPLLGLLQLAVLLLAACSAPTPFETDVVEEQLPSPSPEVVVSPTLTDRTLPTPQTEILPSPTVADPYPGPQPGSTDSAYPPPSSGLQPEASQSAYPPPGAGQALPTSGAYPPPGSGQALPTSPAYPPPSRATPGATQPAPTLAATQTFPPTVSTPLVTPGATPVDRLGAPAMPAPNEGIKTVTIWHAWNEPQAQVLEEVLSAYQRLFPDVYFDVLYVPFDDLLMTFQASAYQGRGPSLLLGPAEWGPELYDAGLVASMDELAVPAFLERINPAALDTARYQGTLIGLPHSIREGVVMYRNRQIIPKAPSTFEELIAAAKEATRGGRVGAYMERGYYYSTGHLFGIGGRLMDENGQPAFTTQKGLDWIHLLVEFEQAGAVSFNTNRDLDLFKAGKVGIIIDGTWNRQALANAIGEENLMIDPWPSYKDGHLSGFIKTDNVYLTSRAQGDERYTALQFIGFLLAPEVQAVLTRANHIPALVEVEVGMEWMQQVMRAFEGAAPLPAHPYSRLYWDPLETALGSVFNKTTLPDRALKQASASISTRIKDIQANP
jgi:arabinogalactan oligomer / maltooligosaccharide transport system substrate-binding protein